jgi:hypothetical protein
MTCDISSCEVTYPYFIGECGSNSCNSLPCKYGGTCQMKGSDVYSCVCKKGFTGKSSREPWQLVLGCYRASTDTTSFYFYQKYMHIVFILQC